MKEVLHEMLDFYGLKEIAGEKHNQLILAMFEEVGYDIDNDETSWCSAALSYFCKRTGFERSNMLDARSWLKLPNEVNRPELGDIVVLWREKKTSWKGHVGLFISQQDDIIYLLGGNQGGQIKISPYPRKRVLGYRKARKLSDILYK